MTRYRYDPATDEVVECRKAPARIGDWKAVHCEALAVEPEHIQFERQLNAERGAPDVDFDVHGAPIFKDKSTYNRYLKAHGKVNRTRGKGNHVLSAALLERMKQRESED